MSLADKLGRVLNEPHRFLYEWARGTADRLPASPRIDDLRYRWLMVPYPQYAYGLREAATLAHALGERGFTAIEFGVAGGRGLLTMEKHAARLAREFLLEIDVVGFDTGAGLPRPTDYRDMPYYWGGGYYPMDVDALRNELQSGELVLGDIAETARDYAPRSPIGFVSVDVDYYSSTVAALRVFEGDDWAHWLPRVHTYFDDLGTIEWIGERQAVADWNAAHNDRKFGAVLGLRDRLPGYPSWAERMLELHLFSHPRYAEKLTDLEVLPMHQR